MGTAGNDARWLTKRLLAWFDGHRRDLPWRRRSDGYAIWVSEIMLQQTQVGRVAEYFGRFLAEFPTVEALAAAPLDRVLRLWEGLGYYGRARALHGAAHDIVARFGGDIPQTTRDLRSLSGIGPYTAAAIASIAFGQPVAALDTNGLRVLARLAAIEGDPRRASARRRVDEFAGQLLDPNRPGDFNQALMDLGASVCTPASPACERCPLARRCGARLAGATARIPSRPAKATRPVVDASCGVVARRGRWLVVQRQASGLLGGLWEFPGARIGPNEAPAQAAERGIREKTGLAVSAGDRVASVRHSFSHFSVVLHVFDCTIVSGRVRGDRARWVGSSELAGLALTRTARRIADRLRSAVTAPHSARHAETTRLSAASRGRATSSSSGAS